MKTNSTRLNFSLLTATLTGLALPVQWWRALGQPVQFRPQVPWWQPFVYQFLALVGRRPVRPSRRRRV